MRWKWRNSLGVDISETIHVTMKREQDALVDRAQRIVERYTTRTSRRAAACIKSYATPRGGFTLLWLYEPWRLLYLLSWIIVPGRKLASFQVRENYLECQVDNPAILDDIKEGISSLAAVKHYRIITNFKL